MRSAIITLTTDFGSSSPYVAQMKGVVLSINAQATVVDVTHGITPQNVREAAIIWDDVCGRFPDETIHVAVVDPGVGTSRAIVYARLGSQHFIAPDNGLLTLVAQRLSPQQIVRLTRSEFWQSPVSPTFHGRDIMAPVAAHLSLGIDPSQFGEPQTGLVMLDLPVPRADRNGVIGEVLAIDSFGNLITNITSDMLPAADLQAKARVGYRDERIEGIRTTYGECDAGTPIALVGSSGRLELAVVNGNAAQQLCLQVGDDVMVTLPPHA